jgi:glutathione synthase/RimK-type ligase-like ATP-grasp enzyme
MAAPLAEAGVAVDGPAWTKAGDLAGYDLVLPLTVWGYHRAGARWTEQVAAWEAAGVPLRNPGSVLRWNSDKGYLGRLAEAGAPVPPTVFTDQVTPEVMAEAAGRFGTDRLVAKPRVSASAYRTLRWSSGEPLDEGPQGPALIQPYLPPIERAGELSLFYIGGRYSHAVRKVPRAGDFRVQPEYEGVITAETPDDDELAAAEAILTAVQEPLLYARVDLVRDLEDRPVLMELELVEPDLYLGHDPAAGRRFAEAVLAELR